MKRIFTIILLVLLGSTAIRGQDPHFSQFYSNPLYLGPSFAGAIDGSRLVVNYRAQWWGIQDSYNTYNFSFDHYFSNFNSGVGLMFFRDVAGTGDLGNMLIAGQYSYNFQVFNTWHIRPGLSFYYTQWGLDFYKLTFIDQVMRGDNTPTIYNPPGTEKIHKVDGSFSTLIYSQRVWIGGTADHLFRGQNFSFYSSPAYKIPLRWTVYGGATIIKQSRLLNPIDETLTLAFNYRSQGNQQQVDLGLYWYKNPLVLGFWYRGIPVVNAPRGDAFIFLLGYKTPKYNFGYSYDFTVSNLLGSGKGSHEISAVYKFNFPTKKQKRGAVPCPEF